MTQEFVHPLSFHAFAFFLDAGTHEFVFVALFLSGEYFNKYRPEHYDAKAPRSESEN